MELFSDFAAGFDEELDVDDSDILSALGKVPDASKRQSEQNKDERSKPPGNSGVRLVSTKAAADIGGRQFGLGVTPAQQKYDILCRDSNDRSRFPVPPEPSSEDLNFAPARKNHGVDWVRPERRSPADTNAAKHSEGQGRLPGREPTVSQSQQNGPTDNSVDDGVSGWANFSLGDFDLGIDGLGGDADRMRGEPDGEPVEFPPSQRANQTRGLRSSQRADQARGLGNGSEFVNAFEEGHGMSSGLDDAGAAREKKRRKKGENIKTAVKTEDVELSPEENAFLNNDSPPLDGKAGGESLRILPGPIGILQRRLAGLSCGPGHDDGGNGGPFLDNGFSRGRPEFTGDEDFSKGPWLSCLDVLDIYPSAFGKPGTGCETVRSIRQAGISMVVMQLAAVVERLQLQPRGDANIEIKDPTGRLEGSLHWKVMADADNKSRIKRGSALLLRKVVVFSPRKGLQYINITLANVVQVFPPDTPIPPVSAFRPSSSGLPGPRFASARSPPFGSTASPPAHTDQSPLANQQSAFAMPHDSHSLSEESPFSSKNPHLHTQIPQSPSTLGTNRVPASPQPVTQIPSSTVPPRPASGSSAQRNSNAAAGGTAGFPTPFTPYVPNPHCNTEMMPKTTPAYRLPAATIERREKAWDFTSIDAEDADICLTPMVPDAALDSHRGVPGSRVSAIREASEEGLQPRDVRSREPPTTESQRGLSPGMNVGIHRPSDSVRMHCGPDAQGEGAADVETRGVESGGDCLRRNVHQERGSEEAADVMKKLGWDADAFGAFFEDDVDGFFAPLNGN